jgi:hypothetical protein
MKGRTILWIDAMFKSKNAQMLTKDAEFFSRAFHLSTENTEF